MISRAGRGSNIILGGFMGTGKSAVGKRLAERLGYEFLDLDELIVAEARLPIAQIFATRGESAFRAMERDMVTRVSTRERCVIATGGGALVEPRNLEVLRGMGLVIALTASAEVILSRVGSSGDRPMLWGGDPRQRVVDLLAERTPAYAKADVLVDTSARSVDEVAEHILSLLTDGPPDGQERTTRRCRPSA
jgi:shikimate kinase